MATVTNSINQDEINSILWKACDTFRGTIDPSEYKNYILVMLFLKYISDVWIDHYEEYRQRFGDDEEMIRRRMGRERFVLPDGCDYYSLYDQRNDSDLGNIIDIALSKIEDNNPEKLRGVFRNISFNSEAALGRTRDRNERLKNLLQDFHDPRLDLRPSRVGNLDVIGNAYEYLIARFASTAGKKAGEFYTPAEVSELLAELLDPQPGERIADPACGSGSLLIKCARQVGSDNYALYGQEVNGSTWALCMMNMFLHFINVTLENIKWADTLRSPQLLEGDDLMRFNVVVANPPFSLDKWASTDERGNIPNDPYNRFWRGQPPKSKGDYAFISHMIETTFPDPAENGRVGVIVPHGVLFRGGSEGKIREQLIRDNLLDAVIGLPANLFYGTGIPAAILIFKRNRSDERVLFIDASRDYEEGTNQNTLRLEDVARVVETYRSRPAHLEKYAYLASFDEMAANDFNLNIPRYVDTFEAEDQIDILAVQQNIEELEEKLAAVKHKMVGYLRELGLDE